MKSSLSVFVGFTVFALCIMSAANADVRMDARNFIVATGIEMRGTADGSAATAWDTTRESEGWKTLSSGGVSVNVLVLNGPLVAGGRLSQNVTWDASRVVVVRDDVVVPSGVTLTLDAGCIVKFTEGARIVVEDGGAVVAEGAYLTSLDDDSVGGDTDMNGDAAGAARPPYRLPGVARRSGGRGAGDGAVRGRHDGAADSFVFTRQSVWNSADA